MMRSAFIFVLLIHGFIHLMGFVSAFQLTSINQLTGKTLIPLPAEAIRIMGVLWLFTCVLFVFAAFVFLFKKEWWWIVTAGGLVLSQALIIIYWPEAKYGTIVNGIVLIAILLGYGTWSFNTLVKQELQVFSAQPSAPHQVITEAMLSQLPPVVQIWLTRSHIVGKAYIQSVHLKQKGEMRTKPEGNWMPVAADEYFTVYKPGFIWVADVKAAPFMHLAGRDKYENGRGHMLIKLLSLYPVADAKGEKTDQGTLLRYLGEIVWFPSAAWSNYIKWEQIDATAARATMNYGGIKASGIFRFNPAGDVISFEAQRYYDRKEGATLENWLVTVDENSYREFEGIRVPTKSAVTWQLNTGDFTWFRLEITDINYNLVSNMGAMTDQVAAKQKSYKIAQ